jgi:tripartite-type tricarboxylate transporter receptor subunit TctC
MKRRQFLRLAACASALPVLPRLALAQTYPSRPVRMIVPYTPAGSPDILGRLIGQWLSERLGQPFVIDNRPGGGSNIGTEAVVNAAPDGYTLLVIAPANAINATLYDGKLNFNFVRDIAPVAGFIRVANVMTVHRCRRTQSRSSSPMPKRTPASSTWPLAATARPTTCPANCSR